MIIIKSWRSNLYTEDPSRIIKDAVNKAINTNIVLLLNNTPKTELLKQVCFALNCTPLTSQIRQIINKH